MKRLIPFFCIACGAGETSFGDAGAPLELDGALAYVDGGTGAVIIVDPEGRAGPDGDRALHRIEVAESPSLSRSLPTPEDPTRRHLVVLDPGAEEIAVVRNRRGDVVHIEVGLPFDAFDVAAGGRYAVAYQPEDQGPQHSLFAFPNAIAVIDLLDMRATSMRLPSASARPRKAAFAPRNELRSTISTSSGPLTLTLDSPLALVFVEGGVVPVDLARAQAGAMIPLGTFDDIVVPEEVIFTANAGDDLRGEIDAIERAFVRGDNGELYVLAISVGPGADGPKPVVALENVVTPDATVYDIELFFADDGRELLLAAAGDELVLVDGYTGVASRFLQEHAVLRLERFVDPTSGRALALGFANEAVLLRLDPLGLDQRRASGLTTLRFADPITAIDIAPGAGRAVLHYADSRTLGILDLAANGEVLDVQMADGAQASALTPDGARMLLVGDSPTDDEPHLAEVRLAPSLSTKDVRLGARGAHVGVVGRWVFVDHGEASGSVTFFPSDDLSRDAAKSFAGVLFTRIFDADPNLEEN